jgi:hypothetical protein
MCRVKHLTKRYDRFLTPPVNIRISVAPSVSFMVQTVPEWHNGVFKKISELMPRAAKIKSHHLRLRFAGDRSSVKILALAFEICPGVAADGADLGRFAGHGDIAADTHFQPMSVAGEGVAVLQFLALSCSAPRGFFTPAPLRILPPACRAFRAASRAIRGYISVHSPNSPAASCSRFVGMSQQFPVPEPELGVLLS